jgi:hypothetical protein
LAWPKILLEATTLIFFLQRANLGLVNRYSRETKS